MGTENASRASDLAKSDLASSDLASSDLEQRRFRITARMLSHAKRKFKRRTGLGTLDP